MTETQWIGPSDAARLLGVSVQSVRDWLDAGRLPHIPTSIGRVVDRADVERLAAERQARQRVSPEPAAE